MPVFSQPAWADYALLDSGGAEKLERFGSFTLRRPDPQALWRKRLPDAEWRAADLRFKRESDRGGRWEGKAPKEWEVGYGQARFLLRPTPFKHIGLFPEQAANWEWVEQRRMALAGAVFSPQRADPGSAPERSSEPPRLLNLFGYTGAASVLAAQAGWAVTHVDASRTSIRWAADNARASGLDEQAVRWICDDAATFAAREVRRRRDYHGILLDPPHYGRGPKGEKWQFEDAIAPLLESCRKLLADGPSFLLLSTYAIGYSPLAFDNMLADFGPGKIESGELALPEGDGSRLLPCGFCARYVREA